MFDTNPTQTGDVERGPNEPLLANEPKDGTLTATVGDHHEPLSALNYFLFMLFGMGTSWTMSDALWLQIPYFQRFQPEKANLAVHFSICVSVVIFLFIPLYIYVEPKLNYLWFMRGILALSFICCIMSTWWWNIVVADISIVLYIAVFISAVVGQVFNILILPYCTKINNYTTGPLSAGFTAGSALPSFYAVIQQPGSANPLFGPKMFNIIVLCSILIPSVIAYAFLERGYLKSRGPRESAGAQDNTEWTCGVPSWWKLIWKYVALHAFLHSMFWAVIVALIPYTVMSTSRIGDMGTGIEQYAFCLLYVGMVIGSEIVSFWRVSVEKSVWMMAMAVFIMFILFLWITFDDTGFWKWEGANVFVVVLLCWMGLLYGVLVPTLMINIDEKFPDHSLKMNQWMNLIAAGSMFVFVWISYFIVD